MNLLAVSYAFGAAKYKAKQSLSKVNKFFNMHMLKYFLLACFIQ